VLPSKHWKEDGLPSDTKGKWVFAMRPEFYRAHFFHPCGGKKMQSLDAQQTKHPPPPARAVFAMCFPTALDKK
jgi:hypothetical protein